MKNILLTIIIAGLMSCTQVLHAGLYEKGGALGTGARAMGLAGAYTALAADETAVLWNPAGLGEVDLSRVGTSLGSIYDGKVRNLNVSAVFPFSKKVVTGISWQHHFYPQASEINADAVTLAGSIPLTENNALRLGGAMKILFGNMVALDASYQGVGLDVGLKYHLELNGGANKLIVGAHLQDLDTRITWADGQVEQIPQRIALGGAFYIDPATVAVMDLEMIHSGQEESEDTRMFRLGLEHWFGSVLGLRGGYLLDNHQLSAFSFGAGLKISDWEVQYALLGQMVNLGVSHRLSVSFGLPAYVPKKIVVKPDTEPALAPLEPEPFKIDVVALPEGFSPNGDGLADTVIFQINLIEGDKTDVAGWQLSLLDAAGTDVRTLSGRDYPEEIEWDGADRTGKICEDGKYRARLALADSNGKVLREATVMIFIRTTWPDIQLKIRPEKVLRIGGRLTRPVVITTTGELDRKDVTWKVVVRNRKGALVQSYRGTRSLPKRLIWRGQVGRRGQAKDGTYEIMLSLADPTGLRKDISKTVALRSVQPVATMRVSPTLIRPGDKKKGKATFSTSLKPNEQVSNWKIVVTNKLTKKHIVNLRGKGPVPNYISWTGKDKTGRFVSGGRYLTAQLVVTYKGGGVVKSGYTDLATDIGLQTAGRALALHLTAIHFDKESATIPLDAYKQLAQASETIKRYAKTYRVQVKGHTDDVEKPGQAMELSWLRAQKVREYLNISGGIPIKYIDIVGYGDKLPIASKASKAGRKKNRRVEIVLIIFKQ